MSATPPTPEAIRGLLSRSGLATARHRAAAARLLGVTETEVLAVQHLAQAGELTPTALRERLGLTSGGTTALLRRLERAGRIVRAPNAADRRSAVVRLAPTVERVTGAPFAALVADVDAAVAALDGEGRRAVAEFLATVAAAADARAAELGEAADRERRAALGVPLPGLWA